MHGVPFPIHLPLLWCVAQVSLSIGTAETSAHCVWPPRQASTAPLGVGKLWRFSPSPCWTLLTAQPQDNGLFLWFLCSSPTAPSLSSPTAVLLFYSLLWCMFSDGWWHGNNPLSYQVLEETPHQPEIFAELSVHLQVLSSKGVSGVYWSACGFGSGWNKQNHGEI